MRSPLAESQQEKAGELLMARLDVINMDAAFNNLSRSTFRFILFWSLVNLLMLVLGIGAITAVVLGVLKLFGVI